MTPARDTLFSTLAADTESFCFDQRVTKVFADMIRRSVPGYASVIAMTGVLGAEYIQPDSQVYDLGCSLGTGLMAVHAHTDEPCTLIGIDNSSAMIEACKNNLANMDDKNHIQIDLRCENILEIDINAASMVIMNYTLQFIAPDKRLALLQKIYTGLKPGGLLLLSEKLVLEDPALDATLTKLYYDFKKHNGYSELEISQKRQALENVLIPETLETHLERLEQAGFEQSMSWFQCLNFHSFVAFKAK